MNKRFLFAGLCLLWCGIIAGIILPYQLILLLGNKMFVPTEGIDPRDLFRGEYVRLGYLFDTVITNESVSDLRTSQYVWIRPQMNEITMVGIAGWSRDPIDDHYAIRAKVQYIDSSETSQTIVQWSDASGFVFVAEPNGSNYTPSSGENVSLQVCDRGVTILDPSLSSGDMVKEASDYGCPLITTGKIISYTTGAHSFRVEYAPTRYYVQQGQGYDTEQAIRGGSAMADWYIWNGKAVLKNVIIR